MTAVQTAHLTRRKIWATNFTRQLSRPRTATRRPTRPTLGAGSQNPIEEMHPAKGAPKMGKLFKAPHTPCPPEPTLSPPSFTRRASKRATPPPAVNFSTPGKLCMNRMPTVAKTILIRRFCAAPGAAAAALAAAAAAAGCCCNCCCCCCNCCCCCCCCKSSGRRASS